MPGTIMLSWGKNGGFFRYKSDWHTHIGLGRISITFMKYDAIPVVVDIIEGETPAITNEDIVKELENRKGFREVISDPYDTTLVGVHPSSLTPVKKPNRVFIVEVS